MAIEYLYLPEGREILYVSSDNPFMREAMETAKNFSSDKFQLTGSVIVKEGRIIGKAANRVILSYSKFQKLHQKGLCPREILGVQSGTKYWLCPGCSGYGSHSESRAISDVKKRREDTNGADLYLWGHWWCCKPCWDKIIEAGIKNVYLLEGSERLFDSRNSENILGKQFL